ncbi:type IV pilus inner membrane component PilO [Phycisphaera mikurensis]|uniref:Uncharacterized protein n=1 Tax=Phycisphaera mikurensis (strain NBRC 102666 / KCTC 22515 / FYK2301M01) TaxID=1142394 RepID=I0II78_PHYMF|nr:hypothetical protein [Phycisphaera mikurensis]MBB6442471.1 Tfp pilus assembly protein PilO [Phycisphaera mikurensis]BAM04966.1 hypothetical protein PSMK_28070 [Phycisphaera mikurensis NBRC 102666]
MKPRPTPSLLLTAAAAGAIVAGSTGAAWLGLVAPARAAAASTQAAASRLAAAKAERHEVAVELAAARAEEARLAERAAAGVVAGRSEERNARLAGLLDLAASGGLEVLRLDPGEPVRAGGWAEVAIELEARGSYAAHRAFLGRIQSGPRDLRSTSLSLRPEGGGLLGRHLLTWSIVPPEAPGGVP